MEPQEGRRISPFRVTKRSTKLRRLSKTTRSRVHVQAVGLNAETKKYRHRADGEECLLTFPFIGLIRALAIRPHWRRWEVEYLARARRRMVACSTQFWQRGPRAVRDSRGPAMAIPLHMVIRSRERRS